MNTISLNNGKVVLTREQAIQEVKTLIGNLPMSMNEHYQWSSVVDFISKETPNQEGVKNAIEQNELRELKARRSDDF